MRKSSSPLAGMVVPARLKSVQAVAKLGEKVGLNYVGQAKIKKGVLRGGTSKKEEVSFSGEKCLNIVFVISNSIFS